MQKEPRLIFDDRARRRKMIKGVLSDIRRKKRVQKIREIIPIVLMVILLSIVFFGMRAVDNWIERFDSETFIYEAEAEEVVEQDTKIVIATITAYTSSVDETDDTPFITASGATTGEGVIACPPKYEFGTLIEIEGRQFTCEDRMNRRYHKEERFDIWVETKSEAYQWGVRELPIQIALR